MRTIRSYEDVVAQHKAVHPDWTPNHIAWVMTLPSHKLPSCSIETARRAVANVFNLSRCHGMPFAQRGETAPVFVTRGRMMMAHVETCTAPGCHMMRAIPGTHHTVD